MIREESDGFKFLLNLEKQDRAEGDQRASKSILARLKG